MSSNNVTFLDYVNSHFGPSSPTSPLYHYTTIDALVNGIIGTDERKEGKEICLRATHCDYLNDTSEIRTGVNYLAQHCNEIICDDAEKQKWGNFIKQNISQWKKYVISLSETDSSLPMWNTYANRGKGIVIGFKNLKSLNPTDLLLKCDYREDHIKSKLNNVQNEEERRYLCKLLYMYIPLILKHKAYSYEEEVRLIGRFSGNVHFREKKGIIVPYKEVYLPKGNMTSITIGPAANQDVVESSLKSFLDQRDFGHVEIYKSSIPYRDF